jgi:type IV pilus assembly protein PilC
VDYSYIAYNKEKKLVRGKVSAINEIEATSILNQGGFQVVNLRANSPFFNIEKFLIHFSNVNTRDVLLLSRQLALLIQSGIDIVTGLELLLGQMTNPTLRTALTDIINELKNGKSLAAAFSKYPNIFPPMYSRAIAAGEQGGKLDSTLRQMADFLEKTADTRKKIKSAMSYPAMLLVVSVIVVLLLTTFVLPTFVNLFQSFGAKLPVLAEILFSIVGWFSQYGVFVIIVLVAGVIAGYLYIRTPTGRYQWDRISLSLPVIGHIIQLNELSYACRLMAMLFQSGIPLPEILPLVAQSANNKIIAEAFNEVRQELIRGEGVSRPMSHRKIFLPLMVQMIAVGEETGHLDSTLITVAETYGVDADDRTKAAIDLIQPIMTVVIGGAVAFIALALVSTMYGIYGQLQP